MSIPEVNRLNCIIETAKLIDNPVNLLSQHGAQLGSTFRYYFGGIQKVLVTSETDIVEHIFKSNYTAYDKSKIQTSVMTEYLGRGLLSDSWDIWHPKRRMMQKGFPASSLNHQAIEMRTALDEIAPMLDQLTGSGRIDLSQYLRTLIFSMTTRALFGVKLPPEDIFKISEIVYQIQKFMVRRVFQPYLNPWFMITGKLDAYQMMRREGDSLLLKHIRDRLINRDANFENLLEELFDMVDPETDLAMSIEQILAEAMQMAVAGHETSANALTWVFTQLGRNPDSLKAIQFELSQVLEKSTLSSETLPDLKVTQAFVNECLRMYPPFWGLDRVALKDDKIGNIEIHKGDIIMAFVYGIHRSPVYWRDPATFCPERFLSDDRPDKDYSFIPFGLGPRRCIAARLSQIQTFLMLNFLLSRYEIEFLPDTPEIESNFTLGKKNGLPVRLSVR